MRQDSQAKEGESASGDVRETAGEEREKRGEVPRKKACTLHLNDMQVVNALIQHNIS